MSAPGHEEGWEDTRGSWRKDQTHGPSLVHTGLCALGAQRLGDISPQ